MHIVIILVIVTQHTIHPLVVLTLDRVIISRQQQLPLMTQGPFLKHMMQL